MSTPPTNSAPIDWGSDKSYLFSFQGNRLSESAREQLLACSKIFWFSTSGTVSRKWIGLSKDGVVASARAVNKHLRVNEKDCWALCLPIEHVGGFSIHARSHESGCSVVELLGAWNPANVHLLMQEKKCTLVSFVPTQLHDLVMLQLRAPPTLRVALIGGASLDPFLRTQALALGWPLLSTYGSTEASSQIACQPLDTVFAPTLPLLEVLSHIKTRTNSKGVLEIFGSSVVELMANETIEGGLDIFNPKDDGWYTTSDHVELTMKSSRHFLQMLGRADRQVKVLGELVSLDALEVEIKSYLLTLMSDVPIIVLIPVSDERRGVVLHLLVENLTNVQLDLDTLNIHLGGLKKIASVRVMKQFPRMENSKIDIKALTSAYNHLPKVDKGVA